MLYKELCLLNHRIEVKGPSMQYFIQFIKKIFAPSSSRLLKTTTLAILLLLAAGINPLKAGQLFPPNNVNNGPSCPTGKVLRWQNGAVDCVSASILPDSNIDGLNIASCTSGNYMTGIKNGSALCNNVLSSKSCSAGYIITGFNADGAPICREVSQVINEYNSLTVEVGAGLLCGAYSTAPGAPGTVACVVDGNSYNPLNSCPPNYRRVGGDFQSPGNRYWFTCARTSNTGNVPTSGLLCGGYADGVSQAPGNYPCVVGGQAYYPSSSCPSGFTRIGGDFQKKGNRYWYTCAKN